MYLFYRYKSAHHFLAFEFDEFPPPQKKKEMLKYQTSGEVASYITILSTIHLTLDLKRKSLKIC